MVFRRYLLSVLAVLLSLSTAVPVYAQITVASEVSSGDATDAQTSVSAPSISLTAGDYIHIVVTHGMSDTVGMAATPLTNTGTAITFSAALDNIEDTNNHQRLVHYYAAITTTQSTVITAAFNGSASYRHIKVKRITGASGYDTHAAQRQDTPGTATDGVSSGNTPALAAQPALISSVTTATAAARTTATGTAFTNNQSSAWQFGTGTNMSASESKRLTATTATAATYTAASNDAQLTVAAVFTESATAPTLSAATPSGTLGTSTTATLGATTDTSSGTFYGVVGTGSQLTGVTETQIKAGQQASGSAAIAACNASVSTTSPSCGVTGLTAATAYTYAAVQNSTGGDSNIVTGTFTTAAASSALLLRRRRD